MTFKEQVEKYLGNLPSKWKTQLTEVLCLIKDDKAQIDCDKVKECETITTLSDFSYEGSVVTITYTNEAGVAVNRSINLENLLNRLLEDVDPSCLTSPEVWASLSFIQKISLIISSQCTCCSGPVTTASEEDFPALGDPINADCTFTVTATNGVFTFEKAYSNEELYSEVLDDLNTTADPFILFSIESDKLQAIVQSTGDWTVTFNTECA